MTQLQQEIAELKEAVRQQQPLRRTNVSRQYATEGPRWRVTVLLNSITLTPRFQAYDHATEYRLAAVDLLSEALSDG